MCGHTAPTASRQPCRRQPHGSVSCWLSTHNMSSVVIDRCTYTPSRCLPCSRRRDDEATNPLKHALVNPVPSQWLSSAQACLFLPRSIDWCPEHSRQGAAAGGWEAISTTPENRNNVVISCPAGY